MILVQSILTIWKNSSTLLKHALYDQGGKSTHLVLLLLTVFWGEEFWECFLKKKLVGRIFLQVIMARVRQLFCLQINHKCIFCIISVQFWIDQRKEELFPVLIKRLTKFLSSTSFTNQVWTIQFFSFLLLSFKYQEVILYTRTRTS